MARMRNGLAALGIALAACAENVTADTPDAAVLNAPSPVVDAPAGALGGAQDDGAATFGDGPALWRASDEDTTLYLFGTIHVLPPDLDWRTPAFNTAFEDANTVYFETPIDDDDPLAAALVVQHGMYPPGSGLLELLDDDEETALENAARRVGIPLNALDRLRPWLAGITLSLAFIQAEGHDPNSGVERVLAPAARAAGKELRYFESTEEQIRFFADLPQAVQLSFLMEGVRQIDEASDLLDRMDTAWLTGDVDALGELMLEDQSSSAPLVYNVLIKQRNEAWAESLNTLADEEAGVFMIAVGAGHIAGKDSLAKLLTERGLLVERVN